MMHNKDFAAFILTHGRADRVITYNALKKGGYTGNIYIVIDNEDKEAEKYEKNYPGQVITFDKLEISKRFDTGDNFNDRRAIIYARNASFEIAEKLGIKYFIQLDDDYTEFKYKFSKESEKVIFKDKYIRNLDNVFDYMLDYYKSIPALTIAMGQGGDYIGGSKGTWAEMMIKRKAMNTFICSTERKFQFVGRINEDVNTYTSFGTRGVLIFSLMHIAINQVQTQANKGGMTDLYLDSGTYIKSFYSVIYSPSCVKLAMMGDHYKRIHHRVSWNNCAPKIIHEKHKKE